jgi:hypothetical protein
VLQEVVEDLDSEVAVEEEETFTEHVEVTSTRNQRANTEVTLNYVHDAKAADFLDMR